MCPSIKYSVFCCCLHLSSITLNGRRNTGTKWIMEMTLWAFPAGILACLPNSICKDDKGVHTSTGEGSTSLHRDWDSNADFIRQAPGHPDWSWKRTAPNHRLSLQICTSVLPQSRFWASRRWSKMKMTLTADPHTARTPQRWVHAYGGARRNLTCVNGQRRKPMTPIISHCQTASDAHFPEYWRAENRHWGHWSEMEQLSV